MTKRTPRQKKDEVKQMRNATVPHPPPPKKELRDDFDEAALRRAWLIAGNKPRT